MQILSVFGKLGATAGALLLLAQAFAHEPESPPASPPSSTGPQSLLPDLVVLPLWFDMQVSRTPEGKSELRFPSYLGNIGKGDLIVAAKLPRPDVRKVRAFQEIRTSDGKTRRRPAGIFRWGEGYPHNHFHLQDMVLYELRTLDGRLLTKTGPAGYAFWDLKPIACGGSGLNCPPELPVYGDRAEPDGTLRQGFQRGWMNAYGPNFDGQIADVTNVPDGVYWLVLTVDPLNRIRESNEKNNTLKVRVELKTVGSKRKVKAVEFVPPPGLDAALGHDHGPSEGILEKISKAADSSR